MAVIIRESLLSLYKDDDAYEVVAPPHTKPVHAYSFRFDYMTGPDVSVGWLDGILRIETDPDGLDDYIRRLNTWDCQYPFAHVSFAGPVEVVVRYLGVEDDWCGEGVATELLTHLVQRFGGKRMALLVANQSHGTNADECTGDERVDLDGLLRLYGRFGFVRRRALLRRRVTKRKRLKQCNKGFRRTKNPPWGWVCVREPGADTAVPIPRMDVVTQPVEGA